MTDSLAKPANLPDTYRGWSIYNDPPPIPVRHFDWRAIHPDYDARNDDGEWVSNGMDVAAATREQLIAEIDAWEIFMTTETAWLIERRVTPPQWSTERSPTGVGAFYSDPHRAYRFPTKALADDAMRRMSITPAERGEYFVSEHSWVDGSPANLPEPHYTPEKGGWRVASGAKPSDYAGPATFSALAYDGWEIYDADGWGWGAVAADNNPIIAYLAKPACICPPSALAHLDGFDPLNDDCPAGNRVGEATCDDIVSGIVAAANLADLRAARARCEAAGLVVLEPKTRDVWRRAYGVRPLFALERLNLIAPEDGEKG